MSPAPWNARMLRALPPKGKPPLARASGLYLHASQNAPLSPFQIQEEGTKYQDLGPGFFASGAFQVSPTCDAPWGAGSYAIASDGTLTLAHFNYDSSD